MLTKSTQQRHTEIFVGKVGLTSSTRVPLYLNGGRGIRQHKKMALSSLLLFDSLPKPETADPLRTFFTLTRVLRHIRHMELDELSGRTTSRPG